MKLVIPIHTNVDKALELIRSNNSKVVELISLMTIFEKRRLRGEVLKLGLKTDLIKGAYKE